MEVASDPASSNGPDCTGVVGVNVTLTPVGVPTQLAPADAPPDPFGSSRTDASKVLEGLKQKPAARGVNLPAGHDPAADNTSAAGTSMTGQPTNRAQVSSPGRKLQPGSHAALQSHRTGATNQGPAITVQTTAFTGIFGRDGEFFFNASGLVTGAVNITASAEVNGVPVMADPLQIIWYSTFDSITLRLTASNHKTARLEATVKAGGEAATGTPSIPVHFEVTPVQSSFTQHVTTDEEGKAVLLLHNPKHHNTVTYRVVASATSIDFPPLIDPVPIVTVVRSDPVLVTWKGHRKHIGDYGYGDSHKEYMP